MDTPSGIKDSIPAWIKFSVQAPGEIPYDGIYYDPPEEVWFYLSSMFGSIMQSGIESSLSNYLKRLGYWTKIIVLSEQ